MRINTIGAVSAALLADLVEPLIKHIPGRIGPLHWGYVLRAWYWRCRGVKMGTDVLIQENVTIYFPDRLTIGSRVSLTAHCVLSGGVSPDATIHIGNDVFLGPGTMIFAANHDYTTANFKLDQRAISKPVVLEDNLWLGAMVGVVAGVRIGRGSVVAMGAVVTKDVPPNTLVAGNPAMPVKTIERSAV